MRNYYDQFVSEKSGNAPGGEPTKPTKDPSARFVGSVHSEIPEISETRGPGGAPDRYAPGDEIFEERVAIMIYDGGFSEAEAVAYMLAANVGDSN